MKKIVLVIICFFAFSSNVFALSKVNRMDVNIEINNEGYAYVTENWQIPMQNNNYFEKIFNETENITISNIALSDSDEENYTYSKRLNKKKNSTYSYKTKGKSKNIRFVTNSKNTTVKLNYEVNGIITKYDDLYSINWNILSRTSHLEIEMLDVYISGPFDFNETNVALYAIGQNISCEFENGKIHIFSSSVPSKTKIKLMAPIVGYEFTNHLTEPGSFQESYEYYKSRTPFRIYVEQIFDSILAICVIVIVILFGIALIIVKIIKKEDTDFKDIKPYKKSKTVGELSSVAYNDQVPCESDIYKMYFIANYYNIIRHRSCLVGAIMFKWILEGIITIENDDEKYYLKLSDNIHFKNSLDKELYLLLVASSTNLVLENNKLIRYATDNSAAFINWYDKVVRASIKDEYKRKNVSVKRNKIILSKAIYNEAVRIQGFKRYLLNFNQVPRKSELTEDAYKYSLISSVLLRVDENFYQELLRKNPNNDGALMLEKFSKVKFIYSNIYSNCIEEFKKDKHNKRDKKRYNPEKKV